MFLDYKNKKEINFIKNNTPNVEFDKNIDLTSNLLICGDKQ